MVKQIALGDHQTGEKIETSAREREKPHYVSALFTS
jgi:hypothetical protein